MLTRAAFLVLQLYQTSLVGGKMKFICFKTHYEIGYVKNPIPVTLV